jgi:hypothetical protein
LPFASAIVVAGPLAGARRRRTRRASGIAPAARPLRFGVARPIVASCGWLAAVALVATAVILTGAGIGQAKLLFIV